MKRAKLPAMKRIADVVLGNVGSAENGDVLTRALGDEPLVREHAAWAFGRLAAARSVAAQRDRLASEPDSAFDASAPSER